MQFTAQELKEQLLRAIDADNNVVDMSSVLEVLSTLEKYPVTKEQLEQTRIGRLVNDVRRKTNNKELARRAKNLVRKWRDFVSLPVNGESRPAVAGSHCNSLPAHVQQGSGSKPSSPISWPGTPSSKSSISPPNSHYVASGSSRPGTPSVHAQASPRSSTSLAMAAINNVCKQRALSNSPELRVGGEQATGVTCGVAKTSSFHEAVPKGNVANKRKRRLAQVAETTKPAKCPVIRDANLNSSSGAGIQKNGSDESYRKIINGAVSADNQGSRSCTSHSVSATSSHIHKVGPHAVGPGTGAQSKITVQQQKPSSKQNSSSGCVQSDISCSVDGSSPMPRSKPDSRVLDRTSLTGRTPKVKTTAEIIQELHNRAGMRLSGSQTVTKIATNQIEREPDIISETVVPLEARPRHRRKPHSTVLPLPASDSSLTRTKNEMVQKFLQSSVHEEPSFPGHSPGSLMDLIRREEQEKAEMDDVCQEEDSQSSFISVPSEPSTTQSSAADQRRSPDPWSLLPPLDVDGIDWNDDVYDVPERPPVTDRDVERMLTEQWPGVNGQYDANNQWHDWREVYSVPSAGNNPLHILPYVCLD